MSKKGAAIKQRRKEKEESKEPSRRVSTMIRSVGESLNAEGGSNGQAGKQGLMLWKEELRWAPFHDAPRWGSHETPTFLHPCHHDCPGKPERTSRGNL